MVLYEIVIVDFPYIDNPDRGKKRPCVLLTKPAGKYDIVIVAFITTNSAKSSRSMYDIVIKPDTKNNLEGESVLQLYKIASIAEASICGSIGYISSQASEAIGKKLTALFQLQDK
jgi:mRNA-degrading endonuclease toxin of MazEF toxin-antitoxin module